MIPYLADHCFDEDIVRGLQRRKPSVDLVLARDAGLAAAEDQFVLEWAAGEPRVILTHDRNTMVGFAIDRIEAGEPMAGLIVVSNRAPTGLVVEQLLLIEEATEPDEWMNRIEYVPL